MTQPESRLQRKIQKALKAQDFNLFVFKVWGSEHMMAGLPDLIGCSRGKFFALEVKMPDKVKNVSASQELVHSLIQRAGGFVRVVCSVEEALEALVELHET